MHIEVELAGGFTMNVEVPNPVTQEQFLQIADKVRQLTVHENKRFETQHQYPLPKPRTQIKPEPVSSDTSSPAPPSVPSPSSSSRPSAPKHVSIHDRLERLEKHNEELIALLEQLIGF